MVLPVIRSHLVLDFIVQVVETFAIPGIACALDGYKRKLHVPTALRVLEVLQDARALAEYTLYKHLLLFALGVCPADSDIREKPLEEKRRNREFAVEALKFH